MNKENIEKLGVKPGFSSCVDLKAFKSMFYFMVYGYWAARKNGFKGVYFASERRLDLVVW